MTLSFVSGAARRTLRPCPLVLLTSRSTPHADRLVAIGQLTRVRRGVFVDSLGWRSLAPWERYLVRVYAALLHRPDAVACFESAAALLGMPVFGDPAVVHLLTDDVGNSREVNGIRTHTSHNDRRIVEIDGTRVVDRVDTAVDLARVRHRAVGLSVADAVLRADPSLHAEMLVAANESRSSSRGRRHARWVTHRATPLAETPLESISRAAVEWLGFDDPELQCVFRTDGYEDRTDMRWRGPDVVGEADGDVKYDESLQPSVGAIWAEKARDRRLRTHVREVAHWGWSDVVRVHPLRAELRRAGLRAHRAEDSRELAGLRTLTRRHQ